MCVLMRVAPSPFVRYCVFIRGWSYVCVVRSVPCACGGSRSLKTHPTSSATCGTCFPNRTFTLVATCVWTATRVGWVAPAVVVVVMCCAAAAMVVNSTAELVRDMVSPKAIHAAPVAHHVDAIMTRMGHGENTVCRDDGSDSRLCLKAQDAAALISAGE